MNQYRISDLEPYSGQVDVEFEGYEKKFKILSLREAAALQSASSGLIEEINAICNCVTLCKNDNRCKCFKLGKKFKNSS